MLNTTAYGKRQSNIFKGFAPCRRPLVNRQLLTGWLLKWVTLDIQTSHFGDLETPFWVPGTPFCWPREPRDHPTGTWRSGCGFLSISFRVILGASWDALWAPFCDFSVIWFGLGCQNGGLFPGCLVIHVFGDPGMEMMPECSVCMRYIHNKNKGLRVISHFPLFHENWLISK